jgi:homogentisate 1,2-dioxygenase
MVSCITPRRLADHPDATAMQPFHQNLDYDEILYRFSGSTGLSEPGGGTFTLHPRGIGHGPKPGFETMPQRASQDAWGLMVDTRLTLKPSTEAARISDRGYVDMMVGRRKTAATA